MRESVEFIFTDKGVLGYKIFEETPWLVERGRFVWIQTAPLTLVIIGSHIPFIKIYTHSYTLSVVLN